MSHELVCRFPLFALLDTVTLSDWLAREHTKALGETLFQAGTPGAWAYIVLRHGSNAGNTDTLRRATRLSGFRPPSSLNASEKNDRRAARRNVSVLPQTPSF